MNVISSIERSNLLVYDTLETRKRGTYDFARVV